MSRAAVSVLDTGPARVRLLRLAVRIRAGP